MYYHQTRDEEQILLDNGDLSEVIQFEKKCKENAKYVVKAKKQ